MQPKSISDATGTDRLAVPVTMSAVDWLHRNPAQPPSLSDHEVHVWTFDLVNTPHQWAERRFELSRDESERSRSFVRETDAKAFLARRIFLRIVISGYLGIPQSRLTYISRCMACGSHAHGKPRLSGKEGPEALEFSASSSGRRGLVAVGRGFPLGADIERLDRRISVEELLRFVSRPEEQRAVRRGTGQEQRRRFLLLWTLKEAYLKGLGLGLSHDPADLLVSFSAGWPDHLSDRAAPPDGPGTWELTAALLPLHRIAIAHRRGDRIRWFQACPPPTRGGELDD
jgi:phosphopantetheinyl transferase